MSKEERKMRKHIEAQAKRELRKALSKARAKVSKPPRERMDVRSAEFEDDFHPPPKSNRTATVRESVAPVSPRIRNRNRPRFLRRPVQPASASDAASPAKSPSATRCCSPRNAVASKKFSRAAPRSRERIRTIHASSESSQPTWTSWSNVVSLKTPPLHPGLIDRYLIAIGKSGAEPR